MYRVERKVCPCLSYVDELYIFDLIELYVKILLKIVRNRFFFLHCILLITKVKLSQETVGRNLTVLLKNGKKRPCQQRFYGPGRVDVYFNSNFRIRFH